MKNKHYTFAAILLGTLGIGISLAGPLLTAQTDFGSTRSRHQAALESRTLQGSDNMTWMDGDNIRYYSVRYALSFERPYRWQGRSFIDIDALLSTGYTPFGLSFDGHLERKQNPDEELRVIVDDANGRSLNDIMNAQKTGNGSSTTLGGKPAIRYQMSNGNEVVTTLWKGKQYDVILRTSTAGERLRNAYENAIQTFRFIDQQLRVE